MALRKALDKFELPAMQSTVEISFAFQLHDDMPSINRSACGKVSNSDIYLHPRLPGDEDEETLAVIGSRRGDAAWEWPSRRGIFLCDVRLPTTRKEMF